MNYSTDKPIDTQEQDLLGRTVFSKQFMNIMLKIDW